MAENLCGSCKLCCTVMRVEAPDADPPFNKPALTPCQHICSAGCSIYESRPSVCSGFLCIWRATLEPEINNPWPNSERPDRTGVVMAVTNESGNVIVHCKTPFAYKDERAWKRICWFVDKGGTVIIEHDSNKVSVVERDYSLSPMRFIGIGENGLKKYMRIR
jgi:hypothetical protein